MNFKYSEDFSINTDEEPWNREGTRIGIFGAPGSTKSFTAAAFIIEQFLKQKGTVIIFQPRAEWHTLKNKYPDVQVIGGPYNQDVPFSASHPKLYAEAVVEKGISMIFYTPEIDDEEKLINFVDHFLDYVMKMQEVRHRPILIVLEEAHEYAPMNAKGHIASPWVFNRMVKRCKDLWTGGRKLNIVPLAITQRPQELHFSIRQLCNLTLYGQFAPQDISYIDKECLSHYRKDGLNVNAGDLKVLAPGNFLVIHHGEAEYKQRTVERITPHGADTPSLEFVPDSSAEVKSAVSSLGQSLKELLEKQAQEESEVKKLNRLNRDQGKKIEALEKKVELGVNLTDLLKGNSGDVNPKMFEENERLNAELAALNKDYDNAKTDNKNSQSYIEDMTNNLNHMAKELPKYKKYAKFAEAVKFLEEALSINDIRFKIMDLMTKVDDLKKGSPTAAPQEGKLVVPPDGVMKDGTLIVEKTETDLEVQVHREKVLEDETTMKGQIATMIIEGMFDKSIKTSTVMTKYKDYYPGEILKKDELMKTLYWFSSNRILKHDGGAGGTHHSFVALDKSRIVVKEV